MRSVAHDKKQFKETMGFYRKDFKQLYDKKCPQ